MKIIIVHSNERSLKKSIEIAEQQGEVYLISEKPFHASLRAAYEMAQDWDWFTLIGGDQYLYPAAIERIEEILKDVKDNVFRLSFHGWDYLYQMNRLMAPCVYRCSLLEAALKLDFSYQMRPESFVKNEMNRIGYSFKIHPDVLAIHDQDQYYRDIYRKGVFSATKSLPFIKKNNILDTLKYSSNPDHIVFRIAIEDSINNTLRPLDDILGELNLKEKE